MPVVEFGDLSLLIHLSRRGGWGLREARLGQRPGLAASDRRWGRARAEIARVWNQAASLGKAGGERGAGGSGDGRQPRTRGLARAWPIEEFAAPISQPTSCTPCCAISARSRDRALLGG